MLVPMLGIVGLALALWSATGIGLGAGLLASIGALLLAQFGLALTDGLAWGAPLLPWAGLGAGVLAVGVRAMRGWRPDWWELVPGIVFAGLMLAHWFTFRDAWPLHWDEFSHWSIVAKEILALNGLPDALSSAAAPQYPPGQGLWIHFMLSGAGYSHGGAVTAVFAPMAAAVACLFQGLDRRSWWWAVPVLPLAALLLANLGHGVASLYVDHLLAVWLGGVLVSALAARRWPHYALLAIPLAVLPLVKEIGLYLAVVGALCVAVMAFFRLGHPLRVSAGRRALMSAALLAVCLAPPILTAQAWSAHVEAAGITRTIPLDAKALRQGFDALLGDVQGHQVPARERFLTVLAAQPLEKDKGSRLFNEFSWAVREHFAPSRTAALAHFAAALAVLLAVRALLAHGSERTMFAALAVVFPLALAVYVVQLGLLYLAIFLPGHAERLPSFIRYAHIVLLPLCMAACAAYLPLARWSPERTALKGGLLVAVVAGWWLLSPPHLEPLASPYPDGELHHQVRELAAPLKARLKPLDKVYVVSNVRDNGFFPVLVKHVLAPARTTVSQPEPLERVPFLKAVQNTGYVWFLSPDTGFAARHPELGAMLAKGVRAVRVNRSTTPAGKTKLTFSPLQ